MTTVTTEEFDALKAIVDRQVRLETDISDKFFAHEFKIDTNLVEI